MAAFWEIRFPPQAPETEPPKTGLSALPRRSAPFKKQRSKERCFLNASGGAPIH